MKLEQIKFEKFHFCLTLQKGKVLSDVIFIQRKRIYTKTLLISLFKNSFRYECEKSNILEEDYMVEFHEYCVW